MKNFYRFLICGAILAAMVSSCRSSSKTTERKENTLQSVQIKKDSTAETETAKIDTKTVKSDSTASETETVVKYTPKKNEATGQYEPFKMNTVKNGKVTGSIEINGNGEVMIKNLTTDVQTMKESTEQQLASLRVHFDTQVSELRKTNSQYEERIKEKKAAVFNLWLVIIILALLLIISVYFNFRPRK
jgi:hypothetical protein